MKKLLFTIISFLILISCSETIKKETKKSTLSKEKAFVENEIIALVLMKSNGKTIEEINKFSNFYTNIVEQNELNSYGWAHYQKGENIVLIERYKDEAAHLNHINNISPGGILEKEFVQFLEHFEIVEIDVYGTVTDKHKSIINSFNFPTSYNTTLAKYSRD
jgi:hypothetical protein